MTKSVFLISLQFPPVVTVGPLTQENISELEEIRSGRIEAADRLANLLSKGYEIVSAVATNDVIVYIVSR